MWLVIDSMHSPKVTLWFSRLNAVDYRSSVAEMWLVMDLYTQPYSNSVASEIECSGQLKHRERETERHRETDREGQTETDRQTEGETRATASLKQSLE